MAAEKKGDRIIGSISVFAELRRYCAVANELWNM